MSKKEFKESFIRKFNLDKTNRNIFDYIDENVIKFVKDIESDGVLNYRANDWQSVVDTSYNNPLLRALIYESYRTPTNFIRQLISQEKDDKILCFALKRQNINRIEFNEIILKINPDVIQEKIEELMDCREQGVEPPIYFSQKTFNLMLEDMLSSGELKYKGQPLLLTKHLLNAEQWLSDFADKESVMTAIVMNDNLSSLTRQKAYDNGIHFEDIDFCKLPAEICKDIYQSAIETYTDVEYKTKGDYKYKIMSAGMTLSSLLSQPNLPQSCQLDLHMRLRTMNSREDIVNLASILARECHSPDVIPHLCSYPSKYDPHHIIQNQYTPSHVLFKMGDRIAERFSKTEVPISPIVEYKSKANLIGILEKTALSKKSYVEILNREDPVLNIAVFSSTHTAPDIACGEGVTFNSRVKSPQTSIEQLFMELASLYRKSDIGITEAQYKRLTDALKQFCIEQDVFMNQKEEKDLTMLELKPYTDYFCLKNLTDKDFEILNKTLNKIKENKWLSKKELPDDFKNIEEFVEEFQEKMFHQYRSDKVFRDLNNIFGEEVFYPCDIEDGEGLTYLIDFNKLSNLDEFDKEKIINIIKEYKDVPILINVENHIHRHMINNLNSQNIHNFVYNLEKAEEFFNVLEDALTRDLSIKKEEPEQEL